MAETSIVLELQRMATDSSADVCELLRKALVVATKLRLNDFREWITHELNGYGGDAVPEYRRIHAEIKLLNPVRGLIPVVFHSEDMQEPLCDILVPDPIGNLIALVEGTKSRGYVSFPLAPTQTKLLMAMQDGLNMPPLRIVAPNNIASIIDLVRNALLDWALKLEEQGILGEGMSFNEAERHTAETSRAIHIDNFQGILGDVTGSSVQQQLRMKVDKGNFESLRAYLLSQGLDRDDVEELRRSIEADGAAKAGQKFGPRVSDWIGRMISKAASGVWAIGLNAAGGFLANALSAYYGIFLTGGP